MSNQPYRSFHIIGQPESSKLLFSSDKVSVFHHCSFLDQHLGSQILLPVFLQPTFCDYSRSKSRIDLEICFVFYHSGICELPGHETQILHTNSNYFRLNSCKRIFLKLIWHHFQNSRLLSTSSSIPVCLWRSVDEIPHLLLDCNSRIRRGSALKT